MSVSQLLRNWIDWKGFVSGALVGLGGGAIVLVVVNSLLDAGDNIVLTPTRPAFWLLAAIALLLGIVNAAPFRPQIFRSIASSDIETPGLAKFVLLVVQLGLLVLVIREFAIENEALHRKIVLLAFGGFLVNHFLAPQYRLFFFVLLSLSGIVSVLGVGDALWLIGLGIGLIVLCRAPLDLRMRIVLLASAGVILALVRIGWIEAPWSLAVLPILASMFMFRLIIYLHDLRYAKAPPRLGETLAYFFLLPNVVFPLFPVVDFSTLRRTYYDSDPYVIYQRGIQWMLRGVIYLLLYRVVYYYLTLAPTEVANPVELIQYVVANFLLLMRVFGQFDLVVGMLLLFGFNLPETNHNAFFASSFADFWRRANVYWKDFMLKIFYYPAYFRLKKRGMTFALAMATLFVFFITWLLHAYQWFWILGTVSLSLPDAMYWAIFAVLMVANLLYENAHGRKQNLGKQTLAPRAAVLKGLRIVGTFVTIAFLWSLWTSASLTEWLALFAPVARP